MIKLSKNPLEVEKVIREVSIMRQLSAQEGNDYTCKLLDVIYPECDSKRSKRVLFLVMEYMPLSLFDILNNFCLA